MELLTERLILKEGEEPQPVHVKVNVDPSTLCTGDEDGQGCFILLQADVSPNKSVLRLSNLAGSLPETSLWCHFITNTSSSRGPAKSNLSSAIIHAVL